MNNKFLFFILIIFLVFYSGNKKQDPTYLFMLNGFTEDSVKEGETLDITFISNGIMAFTDRPYHRTASIPSKVLQNGLDTMINKEKNPPNSSLIVYGEKGITWSGIVEIIDSKLNDNKFIFKLKHLNDDSKKVQVDLPKIKKGTQLSFTIDTLEEFMCCWQKANSGDAFKSPGCEKVKCYR